MEQAWFKKEGMDVWAMCGHPFHVRIGASLSEVVETGKRGLQKEESERIRGKAVRYWCPRCSTRSEEDHKRRGGGGTRDGYTVWQFEGFFRSIVMEFHLYKVIEYNKPEKHWDKETEKYVMKASPKKWEIV